GLEDPARWIAQNAGWEGSIVVDKIKNNKGGFGFNAASEEFEDLMKAGIIGKAHEDPARWIATNAGWEGSVVVDKIKNNKGSFGFNAASEEFEDLMKAGIMDPTKVVRSALQNAASVAGLLLTTECIIAESQEETRADTSSMHSGGMHHPEMT
ncbi:MAG: TCP-1/cpn60 chaperonin family protein, partial [Burkholderiales bacterium]